ncbi:hypothetical protein [Sphingomonas mollis]|uniref:Uncharacterized protein n=1 Tax=Sphingomonas mollis TaxID=2795726 RepID=A0ABS0XQA1_9SPHN|nr:hypothetical protein [Sphingomonas sp. BT553]MBJ6122216.1 hypothetical protein [Sphingomonas sp. BT553]
MIHRVVVASVAKQSSVTHVTLDCFATLATTEISSMAIQAFPTGPRLPWGNKDVAMAGQQARAMTDGNIDIDDTNQPAL